MKIKVYTIDFELSARVKRAISWMGLTVVIVVGTGPTARASIPNNFTPGAPISSAAVNQNFSSLDTRVTVLEANLPAAAIHLQVATCAFNSSQTLTDCTCPNSELAISGGAFAGGKSNTAQISESRNGVTFGQSSSIWRFTCVDGNPAARIECDNGNLFVVCVSTQ